MFIISEFDLGILSPIHSLLQKGPLKSRLSTSDCDAGVEATWVLSTILSCRRESRMQLQFEWPAKGALPHGDLIHCKSNNPLWLDALAIILEPVQFQAC